MSDQSVIAPLSYEMLTQASRDPEAAEYRVLAGLKKADEAFAQGQIYPHLRELIQLFKEVRATLKHSQQIRQMQKRIKSIDLDGGEILMEESSELSEAETNTVLEFMEEVKDLVEKRIEKGKEMFDKIYDDLKIREVGVVPSYKREGYVLVRNPAAGVLCAYRYTTSVVVSEGYHHFGVTMSEQRRFEQGPSILISLSSIKLRLIEEFDDLPNPATYALLPDANVPYDTAILPVVRRKMARYLYRQD